MTKSSRLRGRRRPPCDTCGCAAYGDGMVCAEYRAPAALTTPSDAARTPCSDVPCDTGPGEPCEKHEREWSHAEDDHELCGPECDAELRQRIETALAAAGLTCYLCTCATGAQDGCPHCAKDRSDIAAAVLPVVAEARAAELRAAAADLTADADSLEREPGPLPNNFARGLRQAGVRLRARAGAIHQDGAGS